MRIWLVLHVLAAIAGMGPEIAFGVMGPRARRRGESAAATVYDAISAARTAVVLPALVLQVVSGVALIMILDLPIRGWLRLSLVLYGVAVALVVAILVPTGTRVRRELATGRSIRDLRPLWARMGAVGGLAGALLIAVAVLMVWKPTLG